MPSEPNGEGSGSVPGVIRPPQLSHLEISAKGGRAKSEAKRRASLANFGKSETGSRGDRRATVAREKVDRLATVQAIT